MVKTPNFTGSLSPAAQSLVYDTLVSKHKIFDKLSKTAGEVQNILFIGLGTTFVAPIFIAYNPLSHQDEKTKKYSALRQPISAVIATAMGLGINIPVANAFNRMAAEGKLQKFNMEAKPPSDYLRNRYNSIQKNFSNLNERDKKYLDMVNDGSIKDVKEFAKKYSDFQKFIDAVHIKTEESAAAKLLDPKNLDKGLRNMNLKDFMVNNLKVKTHPHEEKQLNPDYVKKYMKNTSASVFLKEMGINADEATVRTFLGKNFYIDKFENEIKDNQKLAGEMFNIIKKNSQENDFAGFDEKKLEKLFKDSISKKGFDEFERKTISRLSELWVDEKTKGEEKISVKTLFKVLGIEDDFHKHPILDSKMDKFLLWVDKNLAEGILADGLKNQFVEKETAESSKKLLKFAGQIAKNAVQTAESNFKSYSKLQGIVLSLATLPFACGALNWSYPRIMEKCFPKLAGVKVDPKVEPKVAANAALITAPKVEAKLESKVAIKEGN